MENTPEVLNDADDEAARPHFSELGVRDWGSLIFTKKYGFLKTLNILDGNLKKTRFREKFEDFEDPFGGYPRKVEIPRFLL